MKGIKKEYRYFDPNRADAHERKKTMRQAIKAGIVESPIFTLAKTMRKIEEEERRLEKGISGIHKEFGLMKECILEILPEEAKARCLEGILLALKKSEENVTRELIRISRS